MKIQWSRYEAPNAYKIYFKKTVNVDVEFDTIDTKKRSCDPTELTQNENGEMGNKKRTLEQCNTNTSLRNKKESYYEEDFRIALIRSNNNQ